MTQNKKPGETNEPIMDHEYDGIRELDNPLPGWWLATFYITIVFSIVYYAYYQLGSGPTLTEELEAAQTKSSLAVAAKGGDVGPSEADLANAFSNPDKKKAGGAVYATKCASCHGAQGQGLIGPNMTDNFWIHGGKLTDIMKIVSSGVADKGMPPWGALLTKDELVSVVAYIKSLKGTNPPNPKAPQGTETTD